VVVPLMARGQMLGALSLGSATPGRYGRADLELGQELARRAAVAIDNARLYCASQEAARLRQEFICVASHELRTPMTSLKLSLQALQKLPSEYLDRSTIAKAVDRCSRQGDRLEKLITDLLQATQLERGELSLERSQVDLGELASEVLARFQSNLEVAGCEASIHCDARVVGWWDRVRLDQVLSNLVSNAAKFGAGRPIEIDVSEREGIARIVVRDHGIGIDPDRQAYIFERFGRGVSAEHYGGLGLGLYICRKIIEQHGGSLVVESRLDAGAAFTAELSCAYERAPGERLDSRRS